MPEGGRAAAEGDGMVVPADGPRPVALKGSRRALHEALTKLSSELATMYMGGLIVLEHDQNPDPYALCAHALRELIEKLPEHLDVPTKARGESLGAKVNDLQPVWERARASACFREGVWDGQIDAPLQVFLSRSVTFFGWLRDHKPRRRDEAALALRRFDASGRVLPAPLEALNVDLWDEMREFFQSVAHHRRRVERADFLRWVEELERFLLDRLVPRTFDDFDDLDGLMREAGDA